MLKNLAQSGHTKHLLARPFVLLTVVYSHDGYGFDTSWHGYLAASTMSTILWMAYYHVIHVASEGWVRALSLSFALLISGAEATALYLHKGHTELPGYAEAKAEYDRKLDGYNTAFAAWKHRIQQAQDRDAKTLEAATKGIAEIEANGKLTSQRARVDALTTSIASVGSTKPEPAPDFVLKEPMRQYEWNTAWAFTVALLVSLPPISFILLHLFGRRTVTVARVPDLGGETVQDSVEKVVQTTESNDSFADPFKATPDPVEATPDPVEEKQVVTDVPMFTCPVCSKQVVFDRKDRTTCGSNACKKVLYRQRKTKSQLNVVSIRSKK